MRGQTLDDLRVVGKPIRVLRSGEYSQAFDRKTHARFITTSDVHTRVVHPGRQCNASSETRDTLVAGLSITPHHGDTAARLSVHECA